MKISVRKLSEMTGYSTATISNALNFKPNVNKTTAEKIRSLAREYGYQSDLRINKIRFISYRSHGVVVSDTPFFSTLIAGVEKECKNLGYQLVISYLDRHAPDFKQELQNILNDTSTGNILLATEMSEEDLIPFQNCISPLVLLDAWFPNMKMNTIQISNQDSVCEAVDYLYECGHREIGYLKSNTSIKNFEERYAGYAQSLTAHGIVPAEQVVYELTPTMIGAYEDFSQILSNLGKLPTAFFADNDIIAFGCLRALAEQGIRVPEDVSVIGFDDMPFASICTPPLTTIKVSKSDLGSYAVRRLQELSQYHDTTALRSLLTCELVERNSVRRV